MSFFFIENTYLVYQYLDSAYKKGDIISSQKTYIKNILLINDYIIVNTSSKRLL